MVQSTVPSKATLNPTSDDRIDLEQARLAALNQIGRSITSNHDLPRLFTLVLAQIVDLLTVEATALFLKGENGALVFELGMLANHSPIILDQHQAGKEALADLVILDGKPQIVNAVHDSLIPSWTIGDTVGVLTEQILCVPVLSDDNVIGVIEVVNHSDRSPFTQKDANLMACLANQVAVALYQAGLYERVHQAEQGRSDFIDFVSHELNQPMTAIQGYAKMLTMGIGGELSDTQRQFIEVINTNVRRMSKLVSDLLQLSRLEAGRTKLRLAPIHLHEIVQRVIDLTRADIEARHHALIVDVPSSLPQVLGDAEHLIKVLGNLVGNAYQYTPDGGTISIMAEIPDLSGEPPGHLSVSVRDTGIGMSPKEIARLDEKFFRGEHNLVQQQSGSGLGILITRSLVQLHGGEFQVDSTPGLGSTFQFTVPLAES